MPINEMKETEGKFKINHELKERALARDVMNPKVYELPSSALFKDLLEIMYLKNVSSIFIHDMNSSNYYIITDKIVVAFLREQHKNSGFSDLGYSDVYNVPVSYIMTGPVELVNLDTPIDTLIHFMHEKGYARVLISESESGKAVGVVSTMDILMWNNAYFQPSKPIALLIMDNQSSIILGNHIFKENIDEELNSTLMEIYGGALASISAITEEILKKSGEMRVLQKENFTVLLEHREKITGILICDNNSIELRRRLHLFTNKFCKKFERMLNSPNYHHLSKPDIDLTQMSELFHPTKK